MDKPIETIKYRCFNINVYYDDTPMNPCTDWDLMGTLVCWHSRYTLGHEQPKRDPEEYQQDLAINADQSIQDRIIYWEEGAGWDRCRKIEGMDSIRESNNRIEAIIHKALAKHYIILPLYLYDHSGITMSTTPFHCPWDSGQVGFIWVSIKKALEQFNRKKMSKQLRKRIIDCLIAEVKVYDQFISGETYGFMIEPTDQNKEIECDDSCWGFFGYDHEKSGLLDHAKPSIDYAIKAYKEKVINNRNRRIKMDQFMRSCWAY